MSKTLQAKRLQGALERARTVGRLEEEITIDGCQLVLQNLDTQDHPAIIQELEDFAEEEWLFEFQLANVSRSVVEIEGQDMRGVDYIEDEVPAGAHLVVIQVPSDNAAQKIVAKLKADKLKATVLPPDSQETRTIKVPRHEWLKKNVFSNWGHEALVVAWRKFSELRAKADEAAKHGVEFLIPDETAEDKLRRLLTDVDETCQEMPEELMDRVLADMGLLRKARQEDLDNADNQLQAVVKNAPPDVAAPEPVQPRRRSIAEMAQAQLQAEEEAVAPAAAQKTQPKPKQDPEALMANRQPLNTQAMSVPTVPTAAIPTSAQKKAPLPDHIRQAALANTASIRANDANERVTGDGLTGRPVPMEQELTGRAAQLAAIEALDGDDVPQAPVKQQVNTGGLASILDQPPTVGKNPAFNDKRSDGQAISGGINPRYRG